MKLSLLLMLSFALSACPQRAPHEDDEICEHLAEGPSTAVTAVATGEGPAVDDDHRRYDVTLVGDAGARTGRVRFAVAGSGFHRFALNQPVPLALADSAGASVAIEHSETSSPACTEIRAAHTTELAVGTYHLVFGPTEHSTVGLVIERSAHSH